MSEDPVQTPPWERPGWAEEAIAWIAGELARRGRALTGPVTEVKKWSISCVLAAPTADGPVYFKESVDLPLFVHEPRVMRGLAALFPGQVPEVLACDDARRWALMADFGGPFKRIPPLEIQQRVYCGMGAMQVALADREDQMRALGCVERQVAGLAGRIGPLLEDEGTRRAAGADGIAVLASHAARLADLCGELADSPLPAALVHGDLHMGNVAPRAGGYVFFDWTDACASCPFFDMVGIYFGAAGEDQRRLRDAYLALWTDWAPLDELLRLWELAEPLCALHHAVSYQHLLNNLPAATRDQLESDRVYYIGKFVHSLEGTD